jgi:hypothetical protein
VANGCAEGAIEAAAAPQKAARIAAFDLRDDGQTVTLAARENQAAWTPLS